MVGKPNDRLRRPGDSGLDQRNNRSHLPLVGDQIIHTKFKCFAPFVVQGSESMSLFFLDTGIILKCM